MSKRDRQMFALMNRVMEPLFTSRIGQRITGQRTCRIRYAGRRSGKPVELTTWYKPTEDGVRVMVAAPTRKRWWRNFQGTPHPGEVEIDGVRRSAMGLVEGSPKTKVFVNFTYQPTP